MSGGVAGSTLPFARGARGGGEGGGGGAARMVGVENQEEGGANGQPGRERRDQPRRDLNSRCAHTHGCLRCRSGSENPSRTEHDEHGSPTAARPPAVSTRIPPWRRVR